MRCQWCGNRNPDSAQTCAFCQRDLTLEQTTVEAVHLLENLELPESDVICPECGAANFIGTRYCDLCGKPLHPGLLRPQDRHAEMEAASGEVGPAPGWRERLRRARWLWPLDSPDTVFTAAMAYVVLICVFWMLLLWPLTHYEPPAPTWRVENAATREPVVDAAILGLGAEQTGEAVIQRAAEYMRTAREDAGKTPAEVYEITLPVGAVLETSHNRRQGEYATGVRQYGVDWTTSQLRDWFERRYHVSSPWPGGLDVVESRPLLEQELIGGASEGMIAILELREPEASGYVQEVTAGCSVTVMMLDTGGAGDHPTRFIVQYVLRDNTVLALSSW